VTDSIRLALARAASDLGQPDAEFVLERPRDAGHGDLATNLAMVLAKSLKRNPRQLAGELKERISLPGGLVAKIEIAGPGFLNFWLAQDTLADQIQGIIDAGPDYGRSEEGRGVAVNVEFVSANPTGPLHVGHGRGAALGDGIAALLEWTGHRVVREFYINDAGVQIDRLAESLWARVQQAVGRKAAIPEGGYNGDYLIETAVALIAQDGAAVADLPAAEGVARCREYAVQTQREEQDQLLRDFGVRFDLYSSEQALYDDGKVAKALELLAARGLTFEADAALWMRTTQFGDDKDRVLRKSDGSYTYLAPDIAYISRECARCWSPSGIQPTRSKSPSSSWSRS